MATNDGVEGIRNLRLEWVDDELKSIIKRLEKFDTTLQQERAERELVDQRLQILEQKQSDEAAKPRKLWFGWLRNP